MNYFYCHSCREDLYLLSEQGCVRCPNCGKEDAHLKGRKLNIAFKGLTSNFNPHFDITQGQFFGSIEEKKDWLRKKDKVQVEGDHSPRTTGKGRFLCSRDQSRKFKSGNLNKFIKKEDLQPRRIQVGGRS